MDEEILIPIFFFLMVMAIVKMSLDYSRWKRQHKLEQQGSGSLRTSELKEMLRDVVEEANLPLLQRIENLEDKVEKKSAPRLMPADNQRAQEKQASEEIGEKY